MPNKATLTEVTLCNEDGSERTITLTKPRDVWALRQLVTAGEKGCTPIDNPAPRWSAYIFNLRRNGIRVQTVHEPHGGPFAGNHARYVLKTKVARIVEPEGVSA